MSRFKFRAWDEVGQQMVDDVTVYDGGDHVGFSEPTDYARWLEQSNADIGDYGWMFLLDSFVIMQATGKKATGGKLIYEGDILDYGEWGDSDGRCQHVVIWDEARAGFATKEVGYLHYKSSFPLDPAGVIIGNVYENTGLLSLGDIKLLGLGLP